MNTILIKSFHLDEIKEKHLIELKKVFSKAYHNGHMYEDFIKDMKASPKIFRVFLAYDKDEIIGITVIETKPHKFIDYYNYEPIHIKRFTVLPRYRSKGIGKKLLEEAKKYTFNTLNIPVIFGESNELGSLSFYGREKALYSLDIIKQYSKRNTPNENVLFFKEFLSNPKFKTYRYPEGTGILFVFCKSDKEEAFFKEKSFISKRDLLMNNSPL